MDQVHILSILPFAYPIPAIHAFRSIRTCQLRQTQPGGHMPTGEAFIYWILSILMSMLQFDWPGKERPKELIWGGRFTSS